MSRVPPVPCCSSIYVRSVPSSTYYSALTMVHAVVVSRSDQCYDWAHMRLHKLQSVVCSRELAGCDTADYVITCDLDARQWTLVIGASRRHLGPVLQADIIPPHSSTFFISTTRGPSVVQFFSTWTYQSSPRNAGDRRSLSRYFLAVRWGSRRHMRLSCSWRRVTKETRGMYYQGYWLGSGCGDSGRGIIGL